MTGPNMYGTNNTEQQLRRALHDKASTVQTGPHSLEEIQARLDGVVVARATITELHQPRPAVRYLSLAAAGIAAIGGLAYYSQTRSVTSVDLAVPPITAAVIDTPTTTEPSATVTTEPTQVTTVVDSVPAIAPPTGPVAETRADAATEFLSLIGIDEQVELVENGNVVSVKRPEEDTAVVTLNLIQTTDGWAVTGAFSEGITAKVKAFDPEATSSVTVSGIGRGFEASAEVRLVSALDGSMLYKSFAQVGMPEPVPYTTEIEVAGSEQAWAVVISGGGGEGALQEFAAAPISFVAKPDPFTYSVFRIPKNDPDKGLNLRSSPGTDGNTVLATLPAGTPGIRRTASLPVLVGDSVWREVMGPNGEMGWAHTNFLTALDPAISDEELLSIGNRFAQATQQDSHGAFPLLPWSERTQVSYAWIGDLNNQNFRFDGKTLKTGGVWGPDSFRNWAVPEATFGQGEINASHRDFLSLPQGAELEVRVGDGNYAYDFEKLMVSRFLPNLRSVVVSDTKSDGPWSEVHIFVEPSATGGAQIVAIAVSHQIP